MDDKLMVYENFNLSLTPEVRRIYQSAIKGNCAKITLIKLIRKTLETDLANAKRIYEDEYNRLERLP